MDVVDLAGCGAIEADETERAHDAFRAPAIREVFFIAEPILQGDQRGVWTEERRDEGVERRVRRCLQSNKDEVAGANIGGPLADIGIEANGPAAGLDREP